MAMPAPFIHVWQDRIAPLRGRLAAGTLRPPRLPDLMLGIGVASLVLVGIGALGVPAYHQLRLRAKASAVVGNAMTVQLAAETYAAAHQGRYAEDALDLLPYLPRDAAPANPYTGRGLGFDGAPGDLTYRSPTRGRDYVIQAWAMGPGGQPRLVRTLSGHAPRPSD